MPRRTLAITCRWSSDSSEYAGTLSCCTLRGESGARAVWHLQATRRTAAPSPLVEATLSDSDVRPNVGNHALAVHRRDRYRRLDIVLAARVVQVYNWVHLVRHRTGSRLAFVLRAGPDGERDAAKARVGAKTLHQHR